MFTQVSGASQAARDAMVVQLVERQAMDDARARREVKAAEVYASPFKRRSFLRNPHPPSDASGVTSVAGGLLLVLCARFGLQSFLRMETIHIADPIGVSTTTSASALWLIWGQAGGVGCARLFVLSLECPASLRKIEAFSAVSSPGRALRPHFCAAHRVLGRRITRFHMKFLECASRRRDVLGRVVAMC